MIALVAGNELMIAVIKVEIPCQLQW